MEKLPSNRESDTSSHSYFRNQLIANRLGSPGEGILQVTSNQPWMRVIIWDNLRVMRLVEDLVFRKDIVEYRPWPRVTEYFAVQGLIVLTSEGCVGSCCT